MTVLIDTMRALDVELRQILMGLTPRSRASHRFTTNKALDDGQDWKDVEAVPRLFVIEWNPSGSRYDFGSSTYTATVTGRLMVWYPLRGWSLDRLSDVEHVRDALKGIAGAGGGASTVTDVMYRFVNAEEEPSVEETEDGNWLSIPLIALVAVTQS